MRGSIAPMIHMMLGEVSPGGVGVGLNGLLTAENTLAFPNAEVLVPAAEWKYFMDDGEMSRQTTDRMKGVFAGASMAFWSKAWALEAESATGAPPGGGASPGCDSPGLGLGLWRASSSACRFQASYSARGTALTVKFMEAWARPQNSAH